MNERTRSAWYILIRMCCMIGQKWRYGFRHVHLTARLVEPKAVSNDIVVGEYTFVNRWAWIGKQVTLGRYVMLGPGVTIAGGDHQFSQSGLPMYFSGRANTALTVVEDDVWIGARCCIRSGARIGRGSIVGMGSVVLDDVCPYSIVAGVPARLVKMRFTDPDQIAAHEQMLKAPTRRWGDFPNA